MDSLTPYSLLPTPLRREQGHRRGRELHNETTKVWIGLDIYISYSSSSRSGGRLKARVVVAGPGLGPGTTALAGERRGGLRGERPRLDAAADADAARPLRLRARREVVFLPPAARRVRRRATPPGGGRGGGSPAATLLRLHRRRGAPR